MLYKHKIKLIPVLTMVALIAATLSVNVSKAASVVVLSDTMSNQTISALSSHSMVFQVPSGVPPLGTIVVTFPAGFNTTTLAFGTMTAAQGVTSALGTPIVLGASALTTTWGVTVTTTTVTLTSASGTVAAGNYVGITMSTLAAPLITNPGSTGSKIITIAAGADTGSLAVPILTNGLVTITATVDPTITFAIRNAADNADVSTCVLGTLSTAVSSCSYRLAVSTNATSGYTISLNASTGLKSGVNTIAPIGEGTVGTPAAEGYGIAVVAPTTGSVGTFTRLTNFLTDDSSVPVLSVTPLLSVDKPASHIDGTTTATTLITHKAEISAVTPAGAYSQVVTWTVVGNF